MIYAIALIVSQWCDPALAALFTPPRPILGHYETCVDAQPIDRIVAADTSAHYGGVEQTDWLSAFGTAGRYDRGRVARLYGGQPVRIARGWRKDGDRFESLTLISPYPDATLTRLNPGTLVIRFVIDD